MIDGVEEALDVQIQHPGKSPAALARHREGLVRRSARPVAVGVLMEMRVDLGLQTLLNNHLCHPVSYRRNAQRPAPASRFRYLHASNGRRLIAARGHPIPELVQVVGQPRLKLLDRLPINTRRALIGLDLLVGFPDFALRNTKRFGASSPILPLPVVRHAAPGNAAPSVRPDYRAFIPTTGSSAPVSRLGTLALAGVACLNFSLRIATTGSYVPHQSLRWRRATFMPDARQPVSRLRLSWSRAIHISRFRRQRGVSTRHQWFTCVRLTSTHLTEFVSAFSSTLTTRALDPRSLR